MWARPVERIPASTNADIVRAVRNENSQCVRALLLNGASVNARTTNGDTLMHIACELDNQNLIALLIQHKADINAVDANGDTPLRRVVDIQGLSQEQLDKIHLKVMKEKRELETRLATKKRPAEMSHLIDIDFNGSRRLRVLSDDDDLDGICRVHVSSDDEETK